MRANKRLLLFGGWEEELEVIIRKHKLPALAAVRTQKGEASYRHVGVLGFDGFQKHQLPSLTRPCRAYSSVLLR